SNVTVANNTVYGNGTDNCMPGIAIGDLSMQGGSNNVWINNVAQAVLTPTNSACAFCGGANAPLVAGNGDTFVDTNNTYANNVTYGGLGVQLFDNDVNYFSCASNKCDTNPMLVSPAGSNFAVQANSPTIGYGQVVSLLQASPVFAGACSSLFTTCPGNGGAASEFAAVLPGSRSVQLDNTATIFSNMINSGSTALANCKISLPANAPAGLTMDYQATDPATNIPVGTINTPVTIPGNNGMRTFLLSFHGTAAFNASNMNLDYGCSGAASAAVIVGVNTVDLAMSTTPVPDVIALAATATNDGIVVLPTGGGGAFALASANVGVAAPLTVSVDTGTATLPVTATLCQTDPATSRCLSAPAGSVAVNIAAKATPTFSIFLQSRGPIAFAPGASRIFVRFKDAKGLLHGSSSVAIQTK
ncbi:MAG TPA: hypothetical protein VM689_00005, partial [Aliidongia sp.]|nr:hypothetical protein [Aliidongia sp.]